MTGTEHSWDDRPYGLQMQTEFAFAFLLVLNLRDTRTHRQHTHTQKEVHRRFFSVPPPAKQSMPCIATSGASLAAPGGLQAGDPAPDTCLTTALAPSSPHCSHCCNKPHGEEPLMVETPQKPTDTELKPAPTSPGSQGREGAPQNQ